MAEEGRSSGATTRIGRLIECIKAGDNDARKELLEACYARFTTIARRLLNHPDFERLRGEGIETHEVLNEAIVNRIFRKNHEGQDLLDRQQFADPKEFVGAVARHMRYCLLDLLRSRGGAAPRQARQKTNAAAGGNQVVDRIENPPPGNEEKWAIILEAMQQLDEKDREVFHLRYVLGLSRE